MLVFGSFFPTLHLWVFFPEGLGQALSTSTLGGGQWCERHERTGRYKRQLAGVVKMGVKTCDETAKTKTPTINEMKVNEYSQDLSGRENLQVEVLYPIGTVFGCLYSYMCFWFLCSICRWIYFRLMDPFLWFQAGDPFSKIGSHDGDPMCCRKNYGTTPLKTNISPEKWWLEDVFPIEIVPFLGTC